MKTSNPMVRNRAMENVILDSKPMSAQGAATKSLLLLLMVVISAAYTWNMCSNGSIEKANMLALIGAIVAFISALVGFFKPNISHIAAPIYAIFEGLLVGSISFAYNSLYNGIVMNAVEGTLLTLLVMLILYKTKIIKATPLLRKVLIVSMISILAIHLVSWIGSFFGVHFTSLYNSSPLGIGFTIFIIAIAALNLILDFDFFEQGDGRLPDYFEWYAGLSLLVTVIWLYFEILRLLAQLNSRR